MTLYKQVELDTFLNADSVHDIWEGVKQACY
jgi:hypothetical protein